MKLSPVSWIPQGHLLRLIMLQVTLLSSFYCLIHCATNFFHNFTWVYECPYFVGVELLCSFLLREKLEKRNFLIWFDSLVFWWHSSLQFSCSVMSNSFRPHESQHARPSCPSPTPRVHPNPFPSSQWCHPTISSSVVPFSSCPQSFPASGSFQMTVKWCFHIRWPKYWSFSFNISPSNEHPGLISFRMDWLDLLAVQGTLKSLLQHHSSKGSILRLSVFFLVQLSHPYMTLEKP